MKYVKKFLSTLMSILMLTAVFLPILVSAASCSVSATSVSGKQGDTVTVNVNISSIALGSFSINLNFDSSKLQFVSASEGSAATALKYNDKPTVIGSSQVRCTASTSDIVNTSVSGNVMSVRFKILAASGSTSVSTSGDVRDVSGAKISTSYSGGTVTATNGTKPTQPTSPPTSKPTQPVNKSANANLKSLTVQGKTSDGRLVSVPLSPSFSSGVIQYKASIASDVEKLEVKAIAEDGKAKVLSISESYLKMDVGNNTTDITVKAENGSTKKYTISTVKAATGVSPVEETTIEATTAVPESTAPDELTTENPISQSADNSSTELATDAFGREFLDSVSNNIYIKLGVAFGIAAVVFFGVSVCLFISNGKRKSKGE